MIENQIVKEYDTDDYTQVVAYINEEFLRIQEEEEVKQSSKQQSGREELHALDERSLKEVLKEADYRKVEAIAEIIDENGSVTLSEAKKHVVSLNLLRGAISAY